MDDGTRRHNWKVFGHAREGANEGVGITAPPDDDTAEICWKSREN